MTVGRLPWAGSQEQVTRPVSRRVCPTLVSATLDADRDSHVSAVIRSLGVVDGTPGPRRLNQPQGTGVSARPGYAAAPCCHACRSDTSTKETQHAQDSSRPRGNAVIATPPAATAATAYTMDPASGTGFVGKGEVQTVLGLNNKQIQGLNVDFTEKSVTSQSFDWTCTKVVVTGNGSERSPCRSVPTSPPRTPRRCSTASPA